MTRSFVDRPKSMPFSFRLAFDDHEHGGVLDHEIPAIYYAFNALNRFDIPQLLNAPDIPGIVVDPIDGDWEPMPESQAQKNGVSGKIRIVSEHAPLIDIAPFLR
jgi:hypothetical protein